MSNQDLITFACVISFIVAISAYIATRHAFASSSEAEDETPTQVIDASKSWADVDEPVSIFDTAPQAMALRPVTIPIRRKRT